MHSLTLTLPRVWRCVCAVRRLGECVDLGRATRERALVRSLADQCLYGRTRRILCRFRSLIIFPGSAQTIRFYYLQIEHVNLFIFSLSLLSFHSYSRCAVNLLAAVGSTVAHSIAIGERVHFVFGLFVFFPLIFVKCSSWSRFVCLFLSVRSYLLFGDCRFYWPRDNAQELNFRI